MGSAQVGRDGGARMLHHNPNMQRAQHRVIKRFGTRVIVGAHGDVGHDAGRQVGRGAGMGLLLWWLEQSAYFDWGLIAMKAMLGRRVLGMLATPQTS